MQILRIRGDFVNHLDSLWSVLVDEKRARMLKR